MPAEVKSIVFAAAASAGGLCAWILYAAWIPSTSASFAHSAELGWLLGIISGLGDAGWDWDNPSVGIRSGLGMLDGSLYPSFDCKPNSGLQMVPHPGNPASSWPGSEPARSDVQESDDEGSTSSYWAAL